MKKVKIWKEVDILTVNCELGPGFTVFMYVIYTAGQSLHHSLPLNGKYKHFIGLCSYRLVKKTTRNTSHLSLSSVSQMKMISSTSQLRRSVLTQTIYRIMCTCTEQFWSLSSGLFFPYAGCFKTDITWKIHVPKHLLTSYKRFTKPHTDQCYSMPQNHARLPHYIPALY